MVLHKEELSIVYSRTIEHMKVYYNTLNSGNDDFARELKTVLTHWSFDKINSS